MQDLDFLTTVLGLKAPWRIVHADLDLTKKGSIEAVAAYEGSGACPTCGEPASIYDHRERRWRHLDLFLKSGEFLTLSRLSSLAACGPESRLR